MSRTKKVLKQVIEVLKDGGYSAAVITYEGSGDSGQVEDVEIFKPGENHDVSRSWSGEQSHEVALERSGFLDAKKIEVTFTSSNFNHETGEWVADAKDEMVSIKQGLDWLAYEWLERYHGGWEINEGSYGRVVISVEEMKMEMEHNERIVDVHEYSHDLTLEGGEE